MGDGSSQVLINAVRVNVKLLLYFSEYATYQALAEASLVCSYEQATRPPPLFVLVRCLIE